MTYSAPVIDLAWGETRKAATLDRWRCEVLKEPSSYVFLIVGVIIGLGAFEHGNAIRNVHAAIDHFPIDPNVSTMLYVVWYFVSGCMLVFGVTIVWTSFRLRAGDAPRRAGSEARVPGASL
jgi:hypothetical protein